MTGAIWHARVIGNARQDWDGGGSDGGGGSRMMFVGRRVVVVVVVVVGWLEIREA